MNSMITNVALIGWPIVTLILFAFMPAWRATIWTILAGYLLLPPWANFDFAGIPPLDKGSIPSVAALLLAPVMARDGDFRWPRSTTVNVLMLIYILVPFATGVTNAAPIQVSTVFIPGLGIMDSLSSAVGNAIELIPFVLGAALLQTEQRQRELCRAFVVAALAYTPFMLLEIRLSPFLMSKIYGVTNVDYFLQQIRDGGFRAMVFLGHGLLVSTFIAMALLGAIGLARSKLRMFGLSMILVAVYLGVILLLNKSAGAVILTLLLAPAIWLLRSRRLITLLLPVAAIIVTYPAVRGSNLLPFKSMVEASQTFFGEGRAESFEFRLKNEDLLLDRANEKPWFGWGSFGRNRVLMANAWGGASDVTVTDGTWVILIGTWGWVGYVAGFGLLAYPFLRAFRMRRAPISFASMALLCMLLLNLIDLIPNSSLRPITWLIAGALTGLSFPRAGRRPGTRPLSAGGSVVEQA